MTRKPVKEKKKPEYPSCSKSKMGTSSDSPASATPYRAWRLSGRVAAPSADADWKIPSVVDPNYLDLELIQKFLALREFVGKQVMWGKLTIDIETLENAESYPGSLSFVFTGQD